MNTFTSCANEVENKTGLVAHSGLGTQKSQAMHQTLVPARASLFNSKEGPNLSSLGYICCTVHIWGVVHGLNEQKSLHFRGLLWLVGHQIQEETGGARSSRCKREYSYKHTHTEGDQKSV